MSDGIDRAYRALEVALSDREDARRTVRERRHALAVAERAEQEADLRVMALQGNRKAAAYLRRQKVKR